MTRQDRFTACQSVLLISVAPHMLVRETRHFTVDEQHDEKLCSDFRHTDGNFSLCLSSEEPVSACKFYPPSLPLSLSLYVYMYVYPYLYILYIGGVKKN